jgi:hypothetical protein
MFQRTGKNSSMLVTAIFCEPFSVASTIAALLHSDFADDDIHAFSILEGHAPAVREFLLAIGLPGVVVDFYGDCLDEGAVLLTVRVNRGGRKQKIAVELVKRYSGFCAPAKSNDEIMRTFSTTTEHQIE